MYKIGDKVRLICKFIPATSIPCSGTGVIVEDSHTAACKIRLDDGGIAWMFLADRDFVLTPSYHLPEPEFSLEEINLGQELLAQKD